MQNSFNENVSPQVLSALRSDSVIIFPTETLYGIGCSIRHKNAIARVFEIKGRSPNQPPPILIGDANQLNTLVKNIPPSALLLIENFWPGSLTLVLPARAEIPAELCGFNEKQNMRTIAVRQTAHIIAVALCKNLDSPIVATSANFSGADGRAAQPRMLDDIPINFQKLADVVIYGKAVGGAPSTVVDCTCSTPRVLRVGAISLAELRKFSLEIQE